MKHAKKQRAIGCLMGAFLLESLVVGVVWSHPGIDDQIRDVNARLEQAPDDAGLYLRRGELQRIHRDWAAAEADYRKARKLDPGLARVDLCLGTMKLEAGKPKAARKALDRYLSTNPDDVLGRAARARARARSGDHLGAAADFTRALAGMEGVEGGRSRPEYYLERARALDAAGAQHIDRAIQGLDQGLAKLGHPVTLQLLAIDLELKQGRHDAALARVDQIASRAGRQETWLVRKGEILALASRTGEALAAYTKALESIEALPIIRRSNRAVQRLEERARAAIDKLREREQGS